MHPHSLADGIHPDHHVLLPSNFYHFSAETFHWSRFNQDKFSYFELGIADSGKSRLITLQDHELFDFLGIDLGHLTPKGDAPHDSLCLESAKPLPVIHVCEDIVTEKWFGDFLLAVLPLAYSGILRKERLDSLFLQPLLTFLLGTGMRVKYTPVLLGRYADIHCSRFVFTCPLLRVQ